MPHPSLLVVCFISIILFPFASKAYQRITWTNYTEMKESGWSHYVARAEPFDYDKPSSVMSKFAALDEDSSRGVWAPKSVISPWTYSLSYNPRSHLCREFEWMNVTLKMFLQFNSRAYIIPCKERNCDFEPTEEVVWMTTTHALDAEEMNGNSNILFEAGYGSNIGFNTTRIIGDFMQLTYECRVPLDHSLGIN